MGSGDEAVGGERARHLNRVLRSLQKVTRLLGREHDPAELLPRIARTLVAEGGYRAGYLHVPPRPGQGAVGASAGDPTLAPALARLATQSALPSCVTEAMSTGAVVRRHVGDAACQGCALLAAGMAPTDEAAALPLPLGAGRVGALLVVFHVEMPGDAEELALLEDVAGDIAFRLRTLEAEQRALESENRYRTLFDTMAEGVVIADLIRDEHGKRADYRIVDVNASLERHLGTSRDALLGKTVREAFGELTLPALDADAGSPHTSRHFHAGLGKHFRMTLSAMDESRVAIVFEDVTEAERIQTALAERERQYRLLAENVSDVIWVLDVAERRVSYVSSAVERVRGYSAQEALGQELPQRMTPASFADAMAKLDRRVAAYREGEREVYVDVVEQPRKDGGLVVMEVTTRLSTDPSTGRLELYGCSRDVSARVAAEQKARETGALLRESEERYRSLVENLEDVVFTLDAEGRVLVVSGAIARFGFAREDLARGTVLERVHAEDAAIAREALATTLGGRPATVDLRVHDAAGRVRFVRISMRPAMEGDVVRGAHGVMRDRTRQHETEEQLRLAQKMEAVGRLAGGVAHDFNNLLCVIGTYTELALDAVPEGDPLHADLEEIRRASQRAEGLTKQLLAFGRKQLMQPVVFDLNTLLAELEKVLGRLLGEDVDLAVVKEDGLGPMRADRGQVEQVLMNLVVNARDAMPQGGALTIETASVDLHGDEIAGAPAGPYVCLSVSDTGVGMDPQTQSRIFEPFFTTKGAGKGTGLGLAMVYGIVQQSGGGIEVESEPGVGSTFRIYLPQLPGAHEETRVETPRTVRVASPGGQETVLVVEDEESLRKLVGRVLVAAGYRVLSAANAGEALLHCEKHGRRIRLMLTDVVMPGMNGRELAERLWDAWPDLKVLYMSGYTDDAIVDRGALRPGTVLIQKPFTAEDLTAHVRAMLADTGGQLSVFTDT